MYRQQRRERFSIDLRIGQIRTSHNPDVPVPHVFIFLFLPCFPIETKKERKTRKLSFSR